MKKLIISIVILLFFAVPQAVNATPAVEPAPTIAAPEAPPLAISPPVYEEYEEEPVDRSFLLLVLIIVVASGTALAIGFYAYRKIPVILAKIKSKKEGKAKE